MRALQPWQEVVGEIDQIEPTSDGYHLSVGGFSINVSSADGLSEGDKIAVLRTADSHVICIHD